MFVLKWFLAVLVGNFAQNVMTFNPLLTYTMLIRKISAHPNYTVNYTIDQFKEKQFINGYMSVDTDKTVNKLVGVFARCNQEGFDCEYFQTWTLTDLCPKLKQDNQVWSAWYKSFDPPLACPLKRGSHKIINGSFDIGPAVHLYPDVTNYYWKVTQKMFEDDIYIGGYTLDISVFGYRKRIKNVFKPRSKSSA